MTDADLTCERGAPEALFLLELWGDHAAVARRLGAPLPAPCRAARFGSDRLIWWEPSTWLLRTALGGGEARRQALEAAAGEDGAVTEMTGGVARLRVRGAGWRALLMIGGVFDAEAPAFGPDCVAGTVIHHLPVRLDVVSADAVDAYTPPSYAAELAALWGRSIGRLGAEA